MMNGRSVFALVLSFALLTGCMTTKIHDPLDESGKHLLSSVEPATVDDYKLAVSGPASGGLRATQGSGTTKYFIPQLSPIKKASDEIKQDYNVVVSNYMGSSFLSSCGSLLLTGALGLGLIALQPSKYQPDPMIYVGIVTGGAAGIGAFVLSSQLSSAAASKFDSAIAKYNDYLETLRAP